MALRALLIQATAVHVFGWPVQVSEGLRGEAFTPHGMFPQMQGAIQWD